MAEHNTQISQLHPALPKITKGQKEVLKLLQIFRFITTIHFQKLFNHRDSHRVKEWLKDLQIKGYVKRHYSRKDFAEVSKPAIYYLAPKARQILSFEKNLDTQKLEYIYKEHKRGKVFISHCLFIVDIYLFLLSKRNPKEEIKFFTKFELAEYIHFPLPLPDAFIAIKGPGYTRRYFLDLFDEYTPNFVLKKRVNTYLKYSVSSDWDESTNVTALPKILFVCPDDLLKSLTKVCNEAFSETTYDENKISIFLTTKSQIQISPGNNIWQKVE
jgi:hypothetical protein